MTDNPSWQPPVAGDPQVVPPVTPWAAATAPPPGVYATPAPFGAPGPQAGWTPPPKPGLIPLRPLSFGTILGSSFRVMRRNPAPTFGLSALLYGFITIVYVAALAGVLLFSISRIDSASASDQDAILSGTIALFALSALVPIGLAVIATGILQGIIALEVARGTLGEKLTIRGLWRLAKGRLGSLIGYTAALSGVVLVFVLIGAGATFLAFSGVGAAFVANDNPGAAIAGAVLVVILIGGVFVVAAVWIGTKLSLVPSVIMLERLPMIAAIRRSWSLTNRNFWRTFGTQALITVIINLASQVVTTPISIIGGIATTLINPTGDPAAAAATIIVLYVVLGIVSIVVGAIGLVMQSSAYSLIYIDIRMRKEGLDLELLRFVEARNSGTPGVGNPYLVAEGGAQPAAAPTNSPWA